MKIGVSAFAWTGKFDYRHLDLLPMLREQGFEGFEIPMFNPADLDAARVRRAFEANDLECTVCAILPDRINPISSDREVRKRSVQHLASCIEKSADLGAKLLGGPLYAPIGYFPPHRPTEDEWLWALDYFQTAAELLDANQLTLSIEPVNRSETFFLRKAAEAKKLCTQLGHPRIGVTIDTFHANIEEQNIADSIVSLGPHLKHVHASENDRGLLGTGHVDFHSIVAALKAIQYDSYLIIEGFGYAPSDESAPGCLWADVEVSPEDIAHKGAEYLARLVGS
jgi:D-psicose/D-tagatose/L-ribulose 3-epimerase